MTKRITLVFLVLALVFLAIPAAVQAQAGLAVQSSAATVNFPQSLSFSLKATSSADITKIVLRYSIDKITFAPVTSEITPTFTPGRSVDATWTWDMVKSGGLPPGTRVQYSWLIENSAGNRLETTPAIVKFDDTRYPWRSLTTGQVTLYWYQGDQSFAQQLMNAAQQALQKLAQDTGSTLARPVSIYVYDSADALKGGLIFPQEWTGGVAFTEYGIVAIGIATSQLTWGKGAVAHELAHLVTYQMTYNGYGPLPTWLNEGLSMYAEGELDSMSKALLNMAISGDRVFSVRSLSSGFPAGGDDALLAYAQSDSLIEFLVNKYGREKMLQLLNVFKQGSTNDDALQKVYGFNVDGLDGLWRASVDLKPRPASSAATPTPQPLPTLIPFGTTPTPPPLPQPAPTATPAPPPQPTPSPVSTLTPVPAEQSTPAAATPAPLPLSPEPESKRPFPRSIVLVLGVAVALLLGLAILFRVRGAR